MIVTANTWFGAAPKPTPTWSAFLRTFLLPYMMRHGVQAQGIAGGPILQAIIRQGKWLVLCQNPSCKGAEKVWEEGLMMCCSCLNSHEGHQVLPTIFPANRSEIEAILEPRPMENRNWEFGESVERLRLENYLQDNVPESWTQGEIIEQLHIAEVR